MFDVAIFGSGNGTNTQNLIDYFRDDKEVRIRLIVSSNKEAKIVQRAKDEGLTCIILDKKKFNSEDSIINDLSKHKIDFIILAGFLWLIPLSLIKLYRDKIINIHPALLPSFGGKGMFGLNVHKAVLKAKRKESGISIHLVNEDYDKGKIIFQASCRINEKETPESLAEKVHRIEYKYYPKIIKEYITTYELPSFIQEEKEEEEEDTE